MTTQPHTLVLGATGGIGYAVTENLLARQLPVTILVRDRAKAQKLFGNASTLTIIEGDVEDAALLKQLAADKPFIFHGINYPYHQWFGRMETATRNVIEAASPDTTIVFPGNVYNFGNASVPIREDAQPGTNTRKGNLRIELEGMLEEAARAGRCRVLTVRLPDFWGPNVMNDAVRSIFEGALTGKPMLWLATIDQPHQSVYTPDAAEVVVRLMLEGPAKNYQVWNYGGRTFSSMRSFFKQVTALTGKPLRTTVYSRWAITLLGLFMPIMRELKEMLYLYENTIQLDDQALRAHWPDFRETPLPTALTDTLSWFARHQLKQDFKPVAVRDKHPA